jgi:peptidoglycan hydrolase-like protein with peptidoglycan-binding domain/phosphodiesterase/alkaline phosphatase D-like protein
MQKSFIVPRVLAFSLIISLVVLPTAPVFAQLGDVTPPPVEAPPVAPTPLPAEVTPPPVEPVVQTITPPADTIAPAISGVANLSLGINDGTIVWTTDELAVSHLEYGTSESYGTQATLDATALLAHTAILLGLAPNTTYYYCIHATDLAGNTANSCGHSFTTAAHTVIADTTPPDVTLITEGPVTTTSATINFTTSEVGNARIEYGTTAGYGDSTPLDTNLALTHVVTLSNLTPNTEYHYRIISSDEVGNETITSDETFMTEAVSVGVTVQTPADTTAPVVSGVGSVTLGITDATLAWTTNELAVSILEYGTTQSYGSNATLSVTAGLEHTATLTGLIGGTTYYYCIHATDLSSNTTNSCPHSFTTEPVAVTAPVTPTDTTAPQISLITVAPITTTGATVAWTTNELATSQIQYGTTINYGQTSSLGGTASLTHSTTLASLSPDTTYHYRLTSTDTSGNVGLSSDETFTTDALPQVQTQVQSQASTVVITGIELASISTSTVTIAWTTDLLSDSQVEYGDSDNLGSLTTLSSTLTTSHSVTITGLAPNTNYIFRVKSKPLGAMVATVSINDEFNTLTHSIPVVAGPNIISVSPSGITSTGATIAWTTDKAATSQVQYGISSGYGVLSTENLTLATSHSITLIDLEPSTTYHFRVASTDEVSNITFSEDYTFTTSAASSSNPVSNLGGTSVPTAITTLTIGGEDSTSVELEWHVGTANADVAVEYDVRYSTSPIDASNFAQATQAQLTPIYYGDVSPVGTERAYIVAGLNSNTVYYFAIKSKHENSSYSDISNTVSVTTTGGESINNESNQNQNSILEVSTSLGQVVVSSGYGGGGGGGGGTSVGSFEPTLVKAEPADGQIVFEWNNPGEANFVRTVVVKKEGSYPTSPSDGQTIYEGRGDTYADTSLQNGKTYYYAVYSYNHSKTYSRGVNVSLAPNAGNKEVKFNESGSLASSTPIFHFVRTWQKGDKDIEIEHLQEILVADKDSYPEKLVTGYFGSLTQSALKRFQAKHGLSQTGVVDVATQNKLNTVSHSETKLNIPMDVVVFNTDLKRGDQGEAVKDLQQYLIYEGSYVEAIISGYFGNYTHNAVKAFQAKYGVSPVSGFVGYKTRHRMQQLSGM